MTHKLQGCPNCGDPWPTDSDEYHNQSCANPDCDQTDHSDLLVDWDEDY